MIDGSFNPNNGLHTIAIDEAPYYTMHVSGWAYLKAKQTIRVGVTSATDTSWYAQSESGWSAVRVVNPAVGFMADMAATKTIQPGGGSWQKVAGFALNGAGMFNYRDTFNLQTGVFTAPRAGMWRKKNTKIFLYSC